MTYDTRTPHLNQCIESAKTGLKQFLEESVVIPDNPRDVYLDGFVDGWTAAIKYLERPTGVQ